MYKYSYTVLSSSSKLLFDPFTVNFSVLTAYDEPPNKKVPWWTENQEECRYLLWLKLWDLFQVPLLNVIHDLLTEFISPPQATSPDCVWPNLTSGRGGKWHIWVPSIFNTSTDPLVWSPPVIMMAGIKNISNRYLCAEFTICENIYLLWLWL